MNTNVIRLLKIIYNSDGFYPNPLTTTENLVKNDITEDIINFANGAHLIYGTAHGGWGLDDKGFSILSWHEMNEGARLINKSIKEMDETGSRWSKIMNKYNLILILFAFLTLVTTVLGFIDDISWNFSLAIILFTIPPGFFIVYWMLYKIPHTQYLKSKFKDWYWMIFPVYILIIFFLIR